MLQNSKSQQHQKENLQKLYDENVKRSEEQQHYEAMVANKVLTHMVENGNWKSMNSKIDELFMHAAYLIVEYDKIIPLTHDELMELNEKSETDDFPTNITPLNCTHDNPNYSSSQMSYFIDSDGLLCKKVSLPMGQSSFRAHVVELQSTVSVDEQKAAIRERYRKALFLSTPYVLKLKNRDISLVKDLLLYNLVDLDMPEMLLKQVCAVNPLIC
jgi:hypothetical protein